MNEAGVVNSPTGWQIQRRGGEFAGCSRWRTECYTRWYTRWYGTLGGTLGGMVVWCTRWYTAWHLRSHLVAAWGHGLVVRHEADPQVDAQELRQLAHAMILRPGLDDGGPPALCQVGQHPQPPPLLPPHHLREGVAVVPVLLPPFRHPTCGRPPTQMK
eukprot:1177593-Prorocentrum_minimum.AAC.2